MATKTQRKRMMKKDPSNHIPSNHMLSKHDRIKLRGLLFAVREVIGDYDHIDGEFAWEMGALQDASQSVLDELDFQDGVQ